ncbi:MAG: GFA family protein [Myxococcota bacterium]
MEQHALQKTTGMDQHVGTCHCGAVRFAVTVDLGKGGTRCNCSICIRVSQLSAIVKPGEFTLLSDASALSVYAWGGRTGRRYFCTQCGIHCFLRGNLPELGGEYVSVNLNCLENVELTELAVAYWDGRHDNWHAGPRERPWPILTARPA